MLAVITERYKLGQVDREGRKHRQEEDEGDGWPEAAGLQENLQQRGGSKPANLTPKQLWQQKRSCQPQHKTSLQSQHHNHHHHHQSPPQPLTQQPALTPPQLTQQQPSRKSFPPSSSGKGVRANRSASPNLSRCLQQNNCDSERDSFPPRLEDEGSVMSRGQGIRGSNAGSDYGGSNVGFEFQRARLLSARQGKTGPRVTGGAKEGKGLADEDQGEMNAAPEPVVWPEAMEKEALAEEVGSSRLALRHGRTCTKRTSSRPAGLNMLGGP